MKPAVIFDLGNTLAAYYRSEDFAPIMRHAVAGMLDELQRRGLCRMDLDAALAAAAAENREAADFRFTPLQQRLERIFQVSLSADAALAEVLCARFLQPIFAIARVYDDVLPVLAALRAAGHPTGIVSNSPWGSPPEPWRAELAHLGLATAVDDVVLCGDVGWRKPARAIFEFAAARLQRPCASCIFVGDDLHWDVSGSAAAGMRAVLIDRNRRHGGFDGLRINDLAELLPLVASIGAPT